MNASYGQRLASWRKEYGLTQRALGSALAVSQGYISDIEAGRSEPSRNFLQRLSEHFGVSADWVLYGAGEAVPEPRPDSPAQPTTSPDPLLLMICGSAVARVYAALERPLPRDEHYRQALWVLGQVQARMKDPDDGDELEAVLPQVRDLLTTRLLSGNPVD